MHTRTIGARARLAAPGLLALLCLLVAESAAAQPEPMKMPAEKVEPSVAPPRPAVAAPTAEAPAAPGPGAKVRCGGIGSDDSAAMRAQMPQHPLSLLFAQKDGAYLADVEVAIQGPALQPPLRFKSGGPVCLLDLPPGNYEVVLTSPEGKTQKHALSVGGPPRTLQVRF